ncbi:MAG: glutaredoxin 3 [Myxococcales bacterium]|nr:glutaredoxin 3 [Myxococcales bacterium]
MSVPVKIYTTPWCGYCRAAERLLTKKRVAFENQDVSDDPKTRSWLVTASGQTTVPQIFIDGKSIGGFSELDALDRRGELDRLLGLSPGAR